MAEPVQFPEADYVEDYPPPQPSRPLPVKRFPDHNVSCWMLSPQERQEIAKTGRIWLATQTFSSLPLSPDGERHQASLQLTTDKSTALKPWPRPSNTAPAAGRIVTYKDNQQAFDEARDAFQALADHLATGNDWGAFTEQEVQRARQEVMILQHQLACEAIQTDWLLGPALATLKWIARVAAEGVLSNYAVRAMQALHLFG